MKRKGQEMKAVLKYPGAKNRTAKWICGYIPEHNVYLEPFAGSLAVLFEKQRSHIETVNDLDGEIVNFFRVVREQPGALEEKIMLTPYSREEYNAAYQETEDPIERARRFCIRCWMGFGCGNLYRNGFKSGQQSHSPNPAKAWLELPNTIKIASGRLAGVQIEQLPAKELLQRYNTEDVFAYLDPPYLWGTRKNYLYRHEMPDREHEELLDIALNHKGRILISGYENDMYNSYLKGWNKASKETTAERGLKRTEVLWMNYQIDQMDFRDMEVGI